MAEADLSKVIGMIMENPTLVREIREMVERSGNDELSTQSINKGDPESSIRKSSEDAHEGHHQNRRNDLLRAIRPYLSEERGKAIESMIAIADILSLSKKEI